MSSGSWTPDDDTTWHCSCVFAFFWIFTILVETCIRYKFNAFWNVVIISTLLSCTKNILVIKYSELIRWYPGDKIKKAYASEIYRYVEIVNILVHVFKCIGMYQRKRMLTPSQNYADHFVLAFIAIVSVCASLFCLLSPGVACWAWSSPTLAIGLIVTVGYFDFYYVYLVISKYDVKNDQREILQVLMPAIWTALNSVIYAVCSLIYRDGKADFYVNAIWNFTSVLIPLVTIQSCISIKIGLYVQSQTVTSGKATGISAELKSVIRRPPETMQ
ncbi:hypothetical protein BC833DRAFT_653673 [Globomyces pollinis-pini]|nr:hypothetical protein BC833DRAFT_653673 [Globomyces pollinis-pini]